MNRINKITNYDFIDIKCKVLEKMFEREQEHHLHYKLAYNKLLIELADYKETVNKLLQNKDSKKKK